MGVLPKGLSARASVTATPATITLPTLAAGDLLVALFHMEYSVAPTSVTAPSGWTAIGTNPVQGGTTLRLYAYWKTAAGGDSNPALAWSGGTVARVAGLVRTYTGHDTTTPFEATASGSGTTTALTDPSVTALTTGALRLTFAGSVGASASLATVDWRLTSVYNLNTGGTTTANSQTLLAEEVGMGAGATGTRAHTWPASGQWAARSAFIKPATADTFGLLQSAFTHISDNTATAHTITLPNAGTSGSVLMCQAGMWTDGVAGDGYEAATVGGNAMTKDATFYDSSMMVALFSLAGNTGTGTITFSAARANATSTATENTLVAQEWIGPSAIATDATGNAGGNSTTVTSESVTLTGLTAGDRLVLSVSQTAGQGVVWTGDTGYARRHDGPGASGVWMNTYVETRTFTATGGASETTNPTLASADYLIQQVVAYKAAAGAALGGTASGSASATGALIQQDALAGTASGTAGTSGTLAIRQPLGGTASGTAGLSGTLTAPGIRGTASGVGTATGALTTRTVVAGTTPGTATTTGTLTTRDALGGTTTGTATTTGTLTARDALAGLAPGTAGLSGTLTAPSATGTASGVAGLTGTLTLRVALGGTSSGVAGLSGSLVTLVGTIMQTVRGTYGDILAVPDAALAGYVSQGYVVAAAPYVAIASHNPAWDVGPTYRIAHADGRQYAATYANYQQYYQPLGFTIGQGEHGETTFGGGATIYTLTLASARDATYRLTVTSGTE